VGRANREAMPDLTAKRTLVKSPPELWSELSEVERLARHLGAFGEIKITKLEPEHTVAWEGESASGTVSIEPSGWGTKVTLTARVESAAPANAATTEAPAEVPAVEEAVAAEPAVVEPVVEEPEPVVEEPEPAVEEPEPAVDEPAEEVDAQPERKRGFFAWLFRPRSSAQIAEAQTVEAPPEPGVAAVHEPEVAHEAVVEPVAMLEPEPDAGPEPEAELAPEAEPEPVVEPEPVDVRPEPAGEAGPEIEPEPHEPGFDPEHAQAVLDEALEALGSAHHRPFSRG
jgi:hypothetical protein